MTSGGEGEQSNEGIDALIDQANASLDVLLERSGLGRLEWPLGPRISLGLATELIAPKNVQLQEAIAAFLFALPPVADDGVEPVSFAAATSGDHSHLTLYAHSEASSWWSLASDFLVPNSTAEELDRLERIARRIDTSDLGLWMDLDPRGLDAGYWTVVRGEIGGWKDLLGGHGKASEGFLSWAENHSGGNDCLVRRSTTAGPPLTELHIDLVGEDSATHFGILEELCIAMGFGAFPEAGLAFLSDHEVLIDRLQVILFGDQVLRMGPVVVAPSLEFQLELRALVRAGPMEEAARFEAAIATEGPQAASLLVGPKEARAHFHYEL